MKEESKPLLPEKIQSEIASSGINDLNLAESIASNFAPFMAEITEQTDKLKGLELGNEEHAKIAHRVNIDLGKIRSRKNDVKKEQKAYYLNVGRFIDSLANVNEGLISMGQDEAQKFSKYFERMEAERKEKLKSERNALMDQYSDIQIPGLELLDESTFNQMLNNYKVAYEQRIKAEKEAEEARIKAEAEAKAKAEIRAKREELVRPLYSFFVTNNLDIISEMSEEEFNEEIESAKKAKADHEAEQERIRVENERLKKEQEEKDKAEKERTNLQSKRLAELLPYNSYGSDIDMTTLWSLTEAKYSKILASKKAEKEKEDARVAEENRLAEVERKKKQKEEAEKQAELDRIQKELEIEKQRKSEQEAKEKKEREEAEAKRIALEKAPDKEKLNSWVDSMTLPELISVGMSDPSKDLSNNIYNKFQAFKKWAKGEIEKL